MFACRALPLLATASLACASAWSPADPTAAGHTAQSGAVAATEEAASTRFSVIALQPTAEAIPSEEYRRRISEADLPWRIQADASGIELVLVPAGSYIRGGSPGDDEAEFDEVPPREVVLTEPLYVATTEVTRAQWARLMRTNEADLAIDDPELPITGITWREAVDFAHREGLRLPTESEWEYLCRAGDPSSRYGSPNDVAVFMDSSRRNEEGKPLPSPAGSLLPNAWGIYDTLGNAWEWTSTSYTNYSNYPSDRPNTLGEHLKAAS
jgi:formylglycine-generating enzyme required for sulfatase activity